MRPRLRAEGSYGSTVGRCREAKGAPGQRDHGNRVAHHVKELDRAPFAVTPATPWRSRTVPTSPARSPCSATSRVRMTSPYMSKGSPASLRLRLSETWCAVVRRRRQREGDHQAGHCFARSEPSWRSAGRPPGRRRRQYQPAASRCRRNVPRGPVRPADWSGARSSTPSTCFEWRAPPWRASRLQHRQAIPARRHSRRRYLRFQGRSDRALSFDTRLSQDAIPEPPGVLLRVNGYPDFFAGRWMFQ
jgi:hypothetical protein